MPITQALVYDLQPLITRGKLVISIRPSQSDLEMCYIDALSFPSNHFRIHRFFQQKIADQIHPMSVGFN
jgi:hypothetical protein